jgi:hypothetical protein
MTYYNFDNKTFYILFHLINLKIVVVSVYDSEWFFLQFFLRIPLINN